MKLITDTDWQLQLIIIIFQAYPKTKFSKQYRSFNVSYYCFEQFEYGILNDAVACRNYGSESNNEEIFTKIEFKKWNKVEVKYLTSNIMYISH